MKIGILSDTHGKLPAEVFHVFDDVAAIVHCGDVGGVHVLDELEALAPTLAVQGNTDMPLPGDRLPLSRVETVGDLTLAATHGHLLEDAASRPEALVEIFRSHGPDLICYGHSHRYAEEWVEGVLVLNPGAVHRPRDAGGPTVALVEIHGANLHVRRVELRGRGIL